MSSLDAYLARHYLNQDQLLAAAAISVDELERLIARRLVPEPSYVVTAPGRVTSFVFGEMDAEGATPGRYFHPTQLSWLSLARTTSSLTEDQLKEHFSARFIAALSILNRTTWRLLDSFDDEGRPIDKGLRLRTDTAWKYFLNGTFGLCVANPMSEAHIARKEILQEKLTAMSENGERNVFAPIEVAGLLQLIDDYAEASMPFSPVEYHRSSRKRLVDDLRVKLARHSCTSE
jgi:hypothetical protein